MTPEMTRLTIRTDRLLLRPATWDDLTALHEIFTDPVAMRYWDRPPNTELAQTEAFLSSFMRGDTEMRLEYILDLDGVCIGKAGMWKRPEIGYILHPRHWRKGYAFEALSAILPRIWSRFPEEPCLTAELDPRNVGSAKLLEKLGFHLVRVEEKNFLYGEDEWCDTAYYQMPPPE
ncbi:MAG: GNAT family N-acetyltransferase [Pseudomonadota bacterium]